MSQRERSRFAFVGVGSNLDLPEKQVMQACRHLAQIEHAALLRQSSLYRSQPLGPQDQPDFVNAVVLLETTLPPYDLLDALQAIENQQGRVRGLRWGPRVIDLDLLLYGEDELETERLRVPHPGLTLREFVVYPLAEIAPDLILPSGESILSLQAACPMRGLQRLEREA